MAAIYVLLLYIVLQLFVKQYFSWNYYIKQNKVVTITKCNNVKLNLFFSNNHLSKTKTHMSMSTIKSDTPMKDMQFDLGKIAFSLVPLSPESIGKRKTILTEVVSNTIWTLDQLQGIINVNVPVRCTIIKLKGGGLFINNPVAPTKECIDMIRNIEIMHGKVKYITLSSLALEHKGTVGIFSSYFPQSKVYVQPGQYSFPINLPIQFFFPIGKPVIEIPRNSSNAPWGNEIEHHVLDVLKPPGVGGFSETAFYHTATQTLLLTDVIVKVEDEPSAIIQEDPRALLYHARQNMLDIVIDTKENRRIGWRRMVLFGLAFQPSGIKVKDTFEAIKMLSKVSPDMKKLGEGAIPYDGGLYPWEWVKDELPSFRALQGKDKRGLLVSPILQVDNICKWKFKRIIPCHLANDIKATSQDVLDAFDFLYEKPKSNFIPFFNNERKSGQALEEDAQFLSDISIQLTKQNILYPEAPLLKKS